MTAAFIKLLKVWLVLLTVCLALLTVGVVGLGLLLADVSLYDPKAMFTRWSGNYLTIGCKGGEFFVTHLKDVNRHSFAELPNPLLVASSGGVQIPYADLTKLTWALPPDMHESAFPEATNYVAAPPAVGAPVEALYLFPARAKFQTK